MSEHTGIIYGYPRPDGSICYVGQTQQPLEKRHKDHLWNKTPVGAYLLTLAKPPQPRILVQVVSPTHQELVEDLAYWETVMIFKHHTLSRCFPNDGGFNRMVPNSLDYKFLTTREARARAGRICRDKGVGIHGMSPQRRTEIGRKNRASMPLDALKRGGRTAGRINGSRAVELRTGIHAPGFDRAAAGRLAGNILVRDGKGLFGRSPEKITSDARAGGLVAGQQNKKYLAQGRHTRWHVWRGIAKPDCEYCEAAKTA